MTATMTCLVVLSTQLSLGGLGLFDCLKLKTGHHSYRAADCCRGCGSEFNEVQELVGTVQTHPVAKQRVKATKSLKKYDWACHPEIVPALAFALLNDCEKKVRSEAASTLAKLGPCDPEALESLRLASMTDADQHVRKGARKAIDRIGRGCGPKCGFCAEGPAFVGVEVPMPVQYEMELMPSMPGPGVYGEVPFDRIAPLDRLRTGQPRARGFVDPYAPGGVPLTPSLDPYDAPELLPPAIDPLEESGPIEVAPPEPPLPNPPAVSPFGASRETRPAPRDSGSRRGPVRLFTIGRSR